MKKLVTLILLPAMLISVLAGCSGKHDSAGNIAHDSKTESSPSQTLEQKIAAEGKTIKLGTLSFNNLSQQELSDKLNVHYKESGKNYTFAYTYFDNLTSALMALKAGQIDRIDMNQSTAEYIIANNRDVSIRSLHWDPYSFQMAVMDKNALLLGEINTAISAMQADGTLKTLTDSHINSVLKGQNPEKIVMPVTSGDETIRVAVTGDLPPMDYTAADGKPAGFNMAFLAELGKRIHKNIEPVQVDSGARLTALSAGTVDALFWARTTGKGEFQADVPKGMELSTVYFTDEFYGIYLK